VNGETLKAREPLPWPMTAASLLAFASFFFNRRLIAVPAFLAAGVAASWFIPARLRRGSWANWLARLFLYAFVAAPVLTEAVPLPGPISSAAQYVDALTQLCMAELVVQFWQWPRTGGQHSALIVLLSAFIVVAASKTFDTRSFPYLAPAYAVCLVLALRSARVRLAPQAESWRRHVSRAGLLALLAVLLLGLGGSVFIKKYGLLPAPPEADFAKALQAAAKVVGFSDAPRLGSSQNAARSLIRVLLLSCTAPNRQEVLSAATHLRGIAFETYSRGRWERPVSARRYAALNSGLAGGTPAAHAALARLRIVRLTEDTPLLFVPLHCAGVEIRGYDPDSQTAGDRVMSPDSGVHFETSFGGSLLAAGDPAFAYDVLVGEPESQQGPLCAPMNGEQRERCLEVPNEVAPEVRVLAEYIAGGLNNPRERVAVVEEYLRANHKYSLTTHSGAGDPVSNFLLDKKAAHCEYFASAAAILLRCVDVPARYVTGYYVHESAGAGARTVREQDAHAWVEAWLDGAGWVSVDATPPAGRPDQLGAAPPFWRRAAERALDFLAQLWARLGARDWAALALATAIAAALLYWRRQRRLRGSAGQAAGPAYTPPPPHVAAVAAQFERLLRSRRIPCPPQMTWGEHLGSLTGAAGVQKVRGMNLEGARMFLREYNALRFGDQENAESVARAREALGMAGAGAER